MPVNISSKPGIYIHIPYCDTKCGYCDFYSITNNAGREKFIPALINEIKSCLHLINSDVCFDTIYLGGGTPSLLTINEMELLFSFIFQFLPIDKNCEITLEANPGRLTEEKIGYYKSTGINRLSMGIQSFSNIELKKIDRIHSAEQARQNILQARQCGLKNINIDLIFALPGQTQKQWMINLEQALLLNPKHISAYNLIFEKGTPFYKKLQKGLLKKKSDQEELAFFKMAIEFLKKNNFDHYEISNFAASPHYYSRHNYKYWNHTNYLGFGPSAHSFWNGRRWSNLRNVEKYVEYIEKKTPPVGFSEVISQQTEKFETIMLGLRTAVGIDLKKYETKYGSVFFNEYPVVIEDLFDQGFAEVKNDSFRLTTKGIMFCDEIIPRFLPN